MSDTYAGHLLKWTNYIKGYQRRWFVLQNGILSYYRNQQEVSHTCRGSINLANAYIHSEDSLTFVISNGSTQFYLKAISEADRKDWVTALEIARNNAIKAQESDEEGEDISDSTRRADEIQSAITSIRSKLDDLKTCHDLIVRQAASMVRTMQDVEQVILASTTGQPGGDQNGGSGGLSEQILTRLRALLQSTTMFRITSQAMVNAGGSYRELAESSGRRWQRLLQAENEQRQRLEEMVQDLAKQQQLLENEAKRQMGDDATARRTRPSAGQSERPALRNMPATGSSGLTPSDTQRSNSGHASESTLLAAANPIASNKEQSGGNIRQPDSGEEAERNSDSRESSVPTQDDPDLFVDALEHLPDEFSVLIPTASTKRDRGAGISSVEQAAPSVVLSVSAAEDEDTDEDRPGSSKSRMQVKVVPSEKKTVRTRSTVQPFQAPQFPRSSRKRRTTIPDRPNSSISLWSIMKNCIGRDLSKIPLPVNFNEPLSFLQRICEEMEYAETLDLASQAADSFEQMAYVAAFIVSAYASTANRTGKPFNPLLGETYENDRREEFGYRYFAEQVSHHPPVTAIHCESAKWTVWQELSVQSRFRGKYLVIVPIGTTHITFPDGNHYTFTKVQTTVHNIIVGKLWVEHHGEMEITNHKTRDVCHLKFYNWSLFSPSQARQVTGVVADSRGQPRYVVRGKWDDRMEGAVVERIRRGSNSPTGGASSAEYADEVLETGDYRVLWQRRPPPANSARMYNFTQFAIELNDEEPLVCPTDSRNRPDQRMMEAGLWDEANAKKHELEEKQRQARKARELEAERLAAEGRQYPEYQPTWFRKHMDPTTGKVTHVFTGEYWTCKERQDWSRCPEIY